MEAAGERTPHASSEPDKYDAEIDLPNDHTWKLGKDGVWCRFSNGGACDIRFKPKGAGPVPAPSQAHRSRPSAIAAPRLGPPWPEKVRIELRSQALENACRGLSNLQFADHLPKEMLLAVARRAINKAYRRRANSLAFPDSENITLAGDPVADRACGVADLSRLARRCRAASTPAAPRGGAAEAVASRGRVRPAHAAGGRCEMKTPLVAVGGGRGFVVQSGLHRYVITAAHCLPHLPPAEPAAYGNLYANLLGEIGAPAQFVWAECDFVDPVADIAILCSPDNQAVWEEAERYEKLIEPKIPLRVAALPHPPVEDDPWGTRAARLISITCDEFTCRVGYSASSRSLWIEGAEQPIVGGMSGSPILDQDGAAVGLVSVSAGFIEDGKELGSPREGGPNPQLIHCLPGWFLMDLLQQTISGH
jgi:hypothetical protein